MVLDTNVLVSAFFWRGNEREVVRAAVGRRFEAVISMATIRELEGVLIEGFEVPDGTARAYCLLLAVASLFVSPPKFRRQVCRDPDDDRVLEAAVAVGPDRIVSGDKDLLDMRSFQGIQIVRSRALLDLLPGGGGAKMRDD